jgi:hypothetical protein
MRIPPFLLLRIHENSAKGNGKYSSIKTECKWHDVKGDKPQRGETHIIRLNMKRNALKSHAVMFSFQNQGLCSHLTTCLCVGLQDYKCIGLVQSNVDQIKTESVQPCLSCSKCWRRIRGNWQIWRNASESRLCLATINLADDHDSKWITERYFVYVTKPSKHCCELIQSETKSTATRMMYQTINPC